MWVRNDDLEPGYDVFSGHAGSGSLPFNLTDDEAEEYLQELRWKEARRIPLGFAPSRARDSE